jgi:serine/threonine-protein kinase
MSPDQPRPADDTAEEASAFAVLNDYLERLHAGQAPDKAELLRTHPELAPALEYLDALDEMALAAADLGELPTIAGPGRGAAPDPAEGAPGPEGRQFGKYELLGEIGRGGMGVVYKARQRDLDRVVALKMILASRLASADDVSRFEAEARAAARLQHPHIIGVYEAGQIHGQHYFAMQYVAGPSLAELLHKGPVQVDRAVRYVATVARAVAHLHEQGIVHRDLKPSNILLDEDDQPHVTDFGLVKMLQGDTRLTATGAIVGTPSYMSPEQAGGSRDGVGPSSDVYSLGAVLYALLTGRAPFAESTPLDTLVQVLEGEPEPPRRLNAQVPGELEAICLKCLEKAPEDRYPSAAALADDLERCLKGEGIEAQPQGLRHRFRRWLRREPALAWHLIVLAVCAAVGQVQYTVAHHVPLSYHLEVMGTLGLLAVVSVGFHRLLAWGRWPVAARCAWSVTDVLLLTLLLHLLEARACGSPLMACYALLIVGSGLWFRPAVVWLTTGAAVLGYGLLLLGDVLGGELLSSPHHAIIVAIALAVTGFVVAYQVQRVRALSRYYEHRPLP